MPPVPVPALIIAPRFAGIPGEVPGPLQTPRGVIVPAYGAVGGQHRPVDPWWHTALGVGFLGGVAWVAAWALRKPQGRGPGARPGARPAQSW